LTLTSNPLPDPQVLLAAGLSDLAALAAPGGPSETEPAVRAASASRCPKPGLGAATMPPPRAVIKSEPGSLQGASTARSARPSLGVGATPTHDAVDRKRPVATPPTELAAAEASAPRAASDARGAAAAADDGAASDSRAATLATPLESAGADGARRRAARPAGAADGEAAKEAASAPTPVTRAARESDAAAKHALLSPATAAAVELLAGVGATALDSSRAEGYAGEDGVLGSEALYSKFAAAATEGLPGERDGTPSRAPRATECPPLKKAALATRVFPSAGKKRRTLSEAVEQFQFETEKAAAEEMMGWAPGGLEVLAVAPAAAGAPLTSPGPVERASDASAVGAEALFAALAPPPKKRKPRRWLSEDEKVFTCGIDGCARSYGSASSLCAHKRAHHPGWKERREQQRRAQAEAAAARGEAPAPPSPEEDEDEEEDKDDDENDVAGRLARKEGSKALDASARLTPSGAWIESLAADAHARLGALRRSRQRVQRGVRDARAECSSVSVSSVSQTSVSQTASSVAAAAAARLLQNMETALEAEADNLHAWLAKLERLAELRQNAGRALFPEEAEAGKTAFSDGFAAPTPMGPAEARAAARTARETASALAGAAAAFGQGGRKKEKAAKPEGVYAFRY